MEMITGGRNTEQLIHEKINLCNLLSLNVQIVDCCFICVNYFTSVPGTNVRLCTEMRTNGCADAGLR
jgi:hypothetical protein